MDSALTRKLAKVNVENAQLRKELQQMNFMRIQNEKLKFQIKISNGLLSKQYQKLQQTEQWLRSAQNALIQKDEKIQSLSMNIDELLDIDDPQDVFQCDCEDCDEADEQGAEVEFEQPTVKDYLLHIFEQLQGIASKLPDRPVFTNVPF